MRICCLQQIFFQPKMFQTIGFHHQGSYKICVKAYSQNSLTNKKEYGFPIMNRKVKIQQQYDESELDRIQIKQLAYNTKIFDVSFNQQQFTFSGGGCRFKLETELSPNPQSPVFLEVLLKKCSNTQSHSMNQDNKVMESAQNIVKLSSQDQKDNSNQKIGNFEFSEFSSKKRKLFSMSQKDKQETVCKFQILIDNQPDCISKPQSIYQTAIFPNQLYFGKIYFLLSHVKIGFKTRVSQIRLSQFASQSSQQRLTRNSIRKYQQQNSINNSQVSRSSIVSLISSIIDDPKLQFQKFIKQQTVQLNKLIEIEKYLMRSHRSMTNSIKQKNKIRRGNDEVDNNIYQNKTSYISNSNNRKETNLEVCVPQQSVSNSTQSLLSYFECSSQEMLTQTIYEQQCCLAQLICSKWHYLIYLFNNQKWSSSYYHHTINNFKDQILYLSQNKLTLALKPDGQYVQWKPKLKYRPYMHDNLPNMYLKITQRDLKPGISVSTEHILFILVHGFNGNEFDMSRIKSFISFFCTPHFLVLKTISSKIFQNLDTIGKAAAEQISDFIKLRPFIRKINFVGFSLGGIIVRSCLKYLKTYEKLFNLFITLSSPHLGVKQIKSCIVKTGLKVIEKVRGAKNIKQLLLNSQNLQQRGQDVKTEQFQQTQMSYLEVLAKDPCINSFAIVLAIGSQDDKYVPGYSATLDYQGDDQRIIKMQSNLKRNIRNLHQIYVKFSVRKQGTVWQRVTGRRIHINFLDDDSFLYLLLAQYSYIF